jgi:HEAT repeat protein
MKELGNDTSSKVEKLVSILFELVYLSEKQADIGETFQFIRDAVRYCMRHGELRMITQIMKRTQDIMEEPSLKESGKNYFRSLSQYLGQQEMTGHLAEILDSSVEIDRTVYEEFIGYLDRNAIQSLIQQLGELKTVRARKLAIDGLVILGRKDIESVAKGLDDPRWYLVRNIIYILRKIADRRATEFLLKTVRHSDIRVRKEGIKALGELGGRDVIQTLRECLDDADPEIRMTAARAFGTIGTDVAKKIILEKISNKTFREKDFEEKKAFYEVLARWKDETIFDFLIATLRKKALFGRARNDENRACAAFCLSLLGRKDALPELESLRESGSELLKDFVHAAIRKLEHGQ